MSLTNDIRVCLLDHSMVAFWSESAKPSRLLSMLGELFLHQKSSQIPKPGSNVLVLMILIILLIVIFALVSTLVFPICRLQFAMN